MSVDCAQERYVYAEDEALCYKHVDENMQPMDPVTRIPYSTIDNVKTLNEMEFVLECNRREYTFLCNSVEARNRWIENISELACVGDASPAKSPAMAAKSPLRGVTEVTA